MSLLCCRGDNAKIVQNLEKRPKRRSDDKKMVFLSKKVFEVLGTMKITNTAEVSISN